MDRQIPPEERLIFREEKFPQTERSVAGFTTGSPFSVACFTTRRAALAINQTARWNPKRGVKLLKSLAEEARDHASDEPINISILRHFRPDFRSFSHPPLTRLANLNLTNRADLEGFSEPWKWESVARTGDSFTSDRREISTVKKRRWLVETNGGEKNTRRGGEGCTPRGDLVVR